MGGWRKRGSWCMAYTNKENVRICVQRRDTCSARDLSLMLETSEKHLGRGVVYVIRTYIYLYTHIYTHTHVYKVIFIVHALPHPSPFLRLNRTALVVCSYFWNFCLLWNVLTNVVFQLVSTWDFHSARIPLTLFLQTKSRRLYWVSRIILRSHYGSSFYAFTKYCRVYSGMYGNIVLYVSREIVILITRIFQFHLFRLWNYFSIFGNYNFDQSYVKRRWALSWRVSENSRGKLWVLLWTYLKYYKHNEKIYII